jgi:type IV secretory pathway VirJ component
LEAAITSVFEVGRIQTASIGDLPLTELPAKHPKELVIFFSGDGGWRDIDKQIGETLSEAGVAVVGVDSLRYFWSKKSPATIASDIERIVHHYGDAWQVTRVSLIGYSFGAAVIPLVWPKLDPATRNEIKLIAMLGLEPVARLRMSMAGWLGMASSEDISLRPFLAEMPKDKVMCVYSDEEQKAGSTGCTLPELDGATRVERTGGHHFGGAYKEIAQLLLRRLASSLP